jgi:UPF0716 protein FxsA
MRRSRLRWVPLGVLLLIAAEFFVLIGVAKLITLAGAVLGVFALSVLGGLLVRREGLRAWRAMQAAQRSGKPAGDEVLYGVVGLAAALLLAVPGYLTGLAGLILLLPPVRMPARNRIRRATELRVRPETANDLFGPRPVHVTVTKKPPSADRAADDDVIEGEIVD